MLFSLNSFSTNKNIPKSLKINLGKTFTKETLLSLIKLEIYGPVAVPR
jgi:hypothetical protein